MTLSHFKKYQWNLVSGLGFWSKAASESKQWSQKYIFRVQTVKTTEAKNICKFSKKKIFRINTLKKLWFDKGTEYEIFFKDLQKEKRWSLFNNERNKSCSCRELFNHFNSLLLPIKIMVIHSFTAYRSLGLLLKVPIIDLLENHLEMSRIPICSQFCTNGPMTKHKRIKFQN